jgi:hypothetical protein
MVCNAVLKQESNFSPLRNITLLGRAEVVTHGVHGAAALWTEDHPRLAGGRPLRR